MRVLTVGQLTVGHMMQWEGRLRRIECLTGVWGPEGQPLIRITLENHARSIVIERGAAHHVAIAEFRMPAESCKKQWGRN